MEDAQELSDAGLITGGPFHGHVSVVGGCTGASQPSEHAPVGVVGSVASGSKHGAQTVPAAHVAVGKSAARAATQGRQVETHRPSAPAIDTQLGGTKLSAEAITSSGVQKPAPWGPEQAASIGCKEAGAFAAGRQCAPAHVEDVQESSDAGSMSGGPLYGHAIAASGDPASASAAFASTASSSVASVSTASASAASASPSCVAESAAMVPSADVPSGSTVASAAPSILEPSVLDASLPSLAAGASLAETSVEIDRSETPVPPSSEGFPVSFASDPHPAIHAAMQSRNQPAVCLLRLIVGEAIGNFAGREAENVRAHGTLAQALRPF